MTGDTRRYVVMGMPSQDSGDTDLCIVEEEAAAAGILNHHRESLDPSLVVGGTVVGVWRYFGLVVEVKEEDDGSQ